MTEKLIILAVSVVLWFMIINKWYDIATQGGNKKNVSFALLRAMNFPFIKNDNKKGIN